MKTVILAALALYASSANAALLVDSGVPDVLGAGWDLANTPAIGFTLGTGTTITGVEGIFWGYPAAISTVLWTNNSSHLPGAVLQSATISFPNLTFDMAWRGVHGVSWVVPAGSYWVSFSAPYMSNTAINMGTASSPLTYAFDPYGNGHFSPATRETVTLRIYGTGPSTVPEPTSWALLVTGLGAAGATMRSRRARKVPSY